MLFSLLMFIKDRKIPRSKALAMFGAYMLVFAGLTVAGGSLVVGALVLAGIIVLTAVILAP